MILEAKELERLLRKAGDVYVLSPVMDGQLNWIYALKGPFVNLLKKYPDKVIKLHIVNPDSDAHHGNTRRRFMIGRE